MKWLAPMKNLFAILLHELTDLARSEAGEFLSVRGKAQLLAAGGPVPSSPVMEPAARPLPRATATVYYLPSARRLSAAPRSG